MRTTKVKGSLDSHRYNNNSEFIAVIALMLSIIVIILQFSDIDQGYRYKMEDETYHTEIVQNIHNIAETYGYVEPAHYKSEGADVDKVVDGYKAYIESIKVSVNDAEQYLNLIKYERYTEKDFQTIKYKKIVIAVGVGVLVLLVSVNQIYFKNDVVYMKLPHSLK